MTAERARRFGESLASQTGGKRVVSTNDGRTRFRVVSSGTPPIYHILEKCTATFSSYLSLRCNPVFGASAQRISRPSYTAVVALTATCDVLLCQFLVLAGNRFWFYILMYLEYNIVVVLC